MAQEGKFLHYSLVIVFGGAVAALGVHELQRRYAGSEGRGDIKKIVAELHGDNTERAGLSKEAVEVASQHASPEAQQDRMLLERLLRRLLGSEQKKE